MRAFPAFFRLPPVDAPPRAWHHPDCLCCASPKLVHPAWPPPRKLEPLSQISPGLQAAADWPNRVQQSGPSLLKALALAPEPEPVARLLERHFDLLWKDPQAGIAKRALERWLGEQSELVQTAPGRWWRQDKLPKAPLPSRLPTVLLAGNQALVEEAHRVAESLHEEAGGMALVRRIAARDHLLGALVLPQRQAHFWEPDRKELRLVGQDGRERTAFWTASPVPMVHGEAVRLAIAGLTPGRFVRMAKEEGGRLMVLPLAAADEGFLLTERRRLELSQLAGLKRLGLAYREAVRAALAKSPRPLEPWEVAEAMAPGLGYPPDELVVAAVLAAGPEFEPEHEGWRLARPEVPMTRWSPAAQEALEWFDAYGADVLARGAYRAVLLAVGAAGMPAPAAVASPRAELLLWLADGPGQQAMVSLRRQVPLGLPVDESILHVSNPEDLGACLSTAREALALLQARGIQPAEVLVDLSGGTTVMAAAMAIALAPGGAAFSCASEGHAGEVWAAEREGA